MLEKLGLATAITLSLYLLVKVPGPTGPKLGDLQHTQDAAVRQLAAAMPAVPQPSSQP